MVGKTPHRGEACLSLREWREVELTYPRKQAYCGKNCRMDQRILLDGLQDNRVHNIRMAEQTPALFAKAERNGGPVSIVSAFWTDMGGCGPAVAKSQGG